MVEKLLPLDPFLPLFDWNKVAIQLFFLLQDIFRGPSSFFFLDVFCSVCAGASSSVYCFLSNIMHRLQRSVFVNTVDVEQTKLLRKVKEKCIVLSFKKTSQGAFPLALACELSLFFFSSLFAATAWWLANRERATHLVLIALSSGCDMRLVERSCAPRHRVLNNQRRSSAPFQQQNKIKARTLRAFFFSVRLNTFFTSFFFFFLVLRSKKKK